MAAPTATEVAIHMAQTAFTSASIPIASDPFETTLRSTYPPMPLLVKARLLTQFIIRGTALPDFLKQHGRILIAFTTGAAAATGVYHFLQRFRENRAKVQLGVYHIVRQLENLPDLHERLNNPTTLVADIDTEVTRMIGVHLTKDEAADVFLQVKRKLWVCVDERREAIKRQKTVPCEIRLTNTPSNSVIPVSGSIQSLSHATVPAVINVLPRSASNMQIQSSREEEQDVIMADVGHLPAAPVETQLDSAPLPSPTQLTGRSSYQVPNSSSEDSEMALPLTRSHQLTPAPQPPTSPPLPSYGLDYDDENLYSPESPTEQRQKRSENAKAPSMLERATQRAFDPNALGNCPYESPVLPGTKPSK